MGRIHNGVYTTYTEVEVDIDLDDILDDLSDEQIREEYNERFSTGLASSTDIWTMLYNRRRDTTSDEFLKLVDTAIMDHTGRIL